MNASDLAMRMKRLLSAEYGPRLKAVVLYGSESRGEATPDSDVDVMVILDGPLAFGRELRRCIHVLYPLVLDLGRPISPTPVTPDEYQDDRWPLCRRARMEGLVA